MLTEAPKIVYSLRSDKIRHTMSKEIPENEFRSCSISFRMLLFVGALASLSVPTAPPPAKYAPAQKTLTFSYFFIPFSESLC